MARGNLICFIFYTAILIAVLHSLAITFFLYWYYWWFDIPLHFLGGFCVGLLSLWIARQNFRRDFPVSSLQVLLVALMGAIVIGSAWELFEYIAGFTFDSMGNYKLDVIKDLTMDAFGGYIAHLFFLLKDYHQPH